MSLSQRLILSYIVIILISLGCAFVTLILTARPIQNRLNRVRLETQAGQLAATLVKEQPSLTLEQFEPIRDFARRERVRLLLINKKGRVVEDSQRVWRDEQLTNRQDNPVNVLKDKESVFHTEDGTAFTYAVIKPLTYKSKDNYLVVIAPEFAILTRFVFDTSWAFMLAGVVATLVSLLAGILIARSIIRPLEKIATAAEAVAEGDYQHRLAEDGPLEVQQVATSFNLMTAQVEASQQTMRDFVSNVSHELKTPLTSIRGFSQAMLDGATPDEASRQRAAGIIYEEAGRLTRLVGTLLDLSKLESGHTSLTHSPLDLVELLQNSNQRLLLQAQQKQVDIVTKFAPLPPLVGDGDRLAQVFTNLLDNAIRHTPAGGQVSLQARHLKQKTITGQLFSTQPSWIEVRVTDTGSGIPTKDLPRIFERFYRVDKSRKKTGGTGLGLAISKEIVESHGGTIQAERLSHGGSQFTVLLPVLKE
ncbi:ATP-binding protein [Anaerolineales bacterium HSG6]|nr:ATP-binding protein [Anaerolineales bacterium HSG6]MDM8530238.1 ATP-binding protein [Anaerolineales bacterium HSG25]